MFNINNTRAYARIRRFFDFCLHLFTVYPQLIVKQYDTGEGFTHNPLVFSGLCVNRCAVKAKIENSLSSCASARAYARERNGRRGKERWREGRKKLWRFLRKWTHLSRKCTVFFVSRAFVGWGARRVARGCGKMSHAEVEIGGRCDCAE